MPDTLTKRKFLTPLEFGVKLRVLTNKTKSAARVRKTHKEVLDKEIQDLQANLTAQYALLYHRTQFTADVEEWASDVDYPENRFTRSAAHSDGDE